MKKYCLAILLISSFIAFAQDETIVNLRKEADRKAEIEEDTTGRMWRTGGLYNLNLSQGAIRNWAAGGDDFSLSLNSIFNAFAFYRNGRYSWDNTLALQLGYLRTSSLGSRKNDDLADLMSKLGYGISNDWNIATLVNFRTQMLRGFTYEDDVEVFSSAFLSPAYLLVSLGMDYKPNDEFSLFMSPATARWVFVRDDSLSAKGMYGVDSGRHSRTEVGAFITAGYNRLFSRTVSYKGRLDLFSNYLHNPERIDVFMSNLLALKISEWLSVTWNVDLIYDDDVRIFGSDRNSPALQLKSLTGIGLLLRF